MPNCKAYEKGDSKKKVRKRCCIQMRDSELNLKRLIFNILTLHFSILLNVGCFINFNVLIKYPDLTCF